MSEIWMCCQSCGTKYGLLASEAGDQGAFCSRPCERRHFEALFGIQTDSKAAHAQNPAQVDTKVDEGALHSPDVRMRLQNASAVNPSAVHFAAQGVRGKEDTYAFAEFAVCIGIVCKRMYSQDPDIAAVHRDASLDAKVQENHEDRQTDRMCKRLTKDDAQRSGHTQAPEASEIYKRFDSQGWTGSWTWRGWSYNRVPPAIEEAVFERFKQGWSKSALARAFRVNRRTVIRICKAKQ